jgi:1,4-dihydroxy-2-naphthoate polyprenyltransferase
MSSALLEQRGAIVIYLLESRFLVEMGSFAKKIRALVALSRPPFHIVGVLPFILGSVLAWWLGGSFRWEILAWGTAGVVCVMLATYYAGEWWDYAEDLLSGTMHESPFAGGSQVVQRGLLPREAALWGSFAAVLLALGVGVILQFGYHTGRWTLPLGIVGLIGGFFYSAQPARWVQRGWGELWIAFCYGWLTVATGFYLQMGSIAPLVTLVALPIALTIFNVILLNEFLDYWADRATEKTNLVVRLGRENAARLYVVVAIGSWFAFLPPLGQGVPLRALLILLPTTLVSLVAVFLVLRGRWYQQVILGRLCAATLAVNMGVSAAYLFAFLG